MLNTEALKDYIAYAVRTVLADALGQAINNTFPVKSDVGNQMTNQIKEDFAEIASDNFASIVANAIEAYIKGMDITGTVITTGTPTTQTAKIVPAGSPLTAGVIPNTLKVS